MRRGVEDLLISDKLLPKGKYYYVNLHTCDNKKDIYFDVWNIHGTFITSAIAGIQIYATMIKLERLQTGSYYYRDLSRSSEYGPILYYDIWNSITGLHVIDKALSLDYRTNMEPLPDRYQHVPTMHNLNM